MSRPIRVLLADDHTLVRETLAGWLHTAPGLEIVASVASGDEALTRAVAERPDVVLLDIDMPGLQAFEAAELIRQRCPATRVVFLSAFTHDRYIEQALDVGASGYLTKAEPADTVVRAIREVATGGAYFSPEVEARIVFGSDGVKLAQAAQTRSATLTPQQLRILRYLAQGLSKKEIAEVMHLSERTVNRHCDNLMARLDIHDRVGLTRFAIREGLAEP